MDNTFIERDCKFKFQDKEFESGGSWICKCTDGKYRGGVYINDKKGIITTWHGEFLAYLDTCHNYLGNFCSMQRISFTWNGIKMVGDYHPENSDYCKVRSTKKYLEA